MNRLKNKKAIVIGGTSGIGKAIVEKFSLEGANVVFCGRSNEKGLQLEKTIENSKFIYCDITNKNNIQTFFEEAINFLNGLDIAVNNAGISGDIVPFHETNDELLNNVMTTNFFWSLALFTTRNSTFCLSKHSWLYC